MTIMWKIIDAVAHVLYCPTMLGRRSARTRWHHRVHLIPGRLVGWVCDRYDLEFGLDTTDPPGHRWHRRERDACLHEGDNVVILEETDDGQMQGVSTRCPRCGFRSMTIEDGEGNDLTDRFVVSSTPSTWAEWDARFATDPE